MKKKIKRIKKTKSIKYFQGLPKIQYEYFSVQTVYNTRNDFWLYINLLHMCKKYNFKFYNIFINVYFFVRSIF